MTMLTTALLALALTQTKPEAVDAAAFRDKLVLLTDGKQHYVAVDVDSSWHENTFTSSDGKAFHRLPVVGGGRNGTESWGVTFWDPRVRFGDAGAPSVDMADSGAKYSVSCGKKTVPLTQVPAAEAKALLEKAAFFEQLWTRRPEKLLRDETGVYYLVDRFRAKDPNDRRDFRVFSGHKGAMKQLPLKDIVDDHQGMILATKTGNLRLVTGPEGKLEGKWIEGKKVVPLVEIDLDRFDTGRLIYMDLGPYSGQRLGTPCDDLM
ncbi:MAG: hypothetical protein ACOZQL_21305 [Myxococcota bacterium]